MKLVTRIIQCLTLPKPNFHNKSILSNGLRGMFILCLMVMGMSAYAQGYDENSDGWIHITSDGDTHEAMCILAQEQETASQVYKLTINGDQAHYSHLWSPDGLGGWVTHDVPLPNTNSISIELLLENGNKYTAAFPMPSIHSMVTDIPLVRHHAYTYQPFYNRQYVFSYDGFLSLRSGSGIQHTRLGKLYNGYPVQVLTQNRNANWVRVHTGFDEGYVHRDYLVQAVHQSDCSIFGNWRLPNGREVKIVYGNDFESPYRGMEDNSNILFGFLLPGCQIEGSAGSTHYYGRLVDLHTLYMYPSTRQLEIWRKAENPINGHYVNRQTGAFIDLEYMDSPYSPGYVRFQGFSSYGTRVGEVAGEAELSDTNVFHYQDGYSEHACQLEIRILDHQIHVIEEGICGGLNVTFRGRYDKASSHVDSWNIYNTFFMGD